MADHDADLDAIVAKLSDAGLVEEYVNEDSRLALRLTESGARLGIAMAMAGEELSPRRF